LLRAGVVSELLYAGGMFHDIGLTEPYAEHVELGGIKATAINTRFSVR
jgi:hypothetical protein